MKRLITICLMVAYTASVVGITFSLHYCGGHYKGIFFTSDTEKGCCGNGKHKKNCCEDKKITAKIKDSHSSSAKTAILPLFFVDGILGHSTCFTATTIDKNYRICISQNHSPPLIVRPIPIYLLICDLRI